MSYSGVEYWQGVQHILKYLKGFLDYSLFFDVSCNKIELSDYVDYLNTCKATLVNFFF